MLVALGKQMIYECECIQTNRGELQELPAVLLNDSRLRVTFF